jgi:hypothetical protein
MSTKTTLVLNKLKQTASCEVIDETTGGGSEGAGSFESAGRNSYSQKNDTRIFY